MYDVCVYLSSLPRKTDRNRKIQALESFAAGAQAAGANVFLQKEYATVPAKLAVILGWVGQEITGQHIRLRYDVIAEQKLKQQHVMAIDANCFKFLDVGNTFLRYSLDGVRYNVNNYANSNSTPDKWNQLQKILGISMQPWRANGSHIVICLQRDTGWSAKGTDMLLWAHSIVQQIRKISTRPILIRPHPKVKIDMSSLISLPNVKASIPEASLQQDLQNAWAGFFYNSSSSVAAIMMGIPVFATDSDCVAWHVSNQSVLTLENPILPEREQWMYNLASAHWSDEESKQGAIYKKFQQFL